MQNEENWISVEERLPPAGELVEVKGDYTPNKYDYPKAYRKVSSYNEKFWDWMSTEWRGTAGVRFWRKIVK